MVCIPFDLGIYQSLIGVVSLIILMILILTFMASKVLRLQNLEAWFNVEFSEFFASFFIIFFAIGFFLASNLIATSISGGASCSAIEASTTFLQNTLSNVFKGVKDIIDLQVCISVLSTFTRRTGEFVLTLTYKVFPGLDSYIGVTNVLLFGLNTAFGSLNVQLILFQIIDAVMFKFFLPAGILLRFFPPTRDAGMFMIAFAIGFQSIFPLTYFISQQILHEIKYDSYTSYTYDKYSICGGKYITYGAIGNPAFFGSIPLLGNFVDKAPLGKIIGTGYRAVFSELGVTMMTPSEFQPILESIASLSLPALFLPAFSLTITFAFINVFIKFVLMKM